MQANKYRSVYMRSKKDGVCELLKDTFDSKEELKKTVSEYAAKGFKVHYNS